MDCVLLRFDLEHNRLAFSCANNGLWIVREGELIEYKPDKQPVGLHEGNIKPFQLHEAQLRKGDFIIAYTDGFADQFGGERGKKFKYSQLKTLLTEIAGEQPSVQHQRLDTAFTQWKGNLEQVDDVLIVGIRI
jgi:serine phosphatase RsbU (regulator of sigma subunit)